MDVTSTTYTNTTYGASSGTAGSATGQGTMISSDFETFLKMLTVQMENQDPLNPIESSDYAVQLATFSGVEQQVRTNDLLKEVQAQLGVLSMSDLVGWVGMEARATTSAYFQLAPVDLALAPASGATSAFVVVRDAAGQQVDWFEVSVAEESTQWAGLGPTGTLMPEGDYSFHLQSYNVDGLMTEAQMAVYSEVVEAKVEGGQTILILASGDEIAATDVDALRAPQG
ncbi:flagellar hook capping FlgD N-terminal domain-containing protein [Maritimibacter sp. DP1N21-5]|uniref:flagellar hook capping FlgD N-terminal domain-containing protein n=1 Tax=Maritimibacter sp. DP1N21-5 TaxID=2836867 RepID=UPI001C46654D|nr:flagellar hook capping FlgD N-terminal domain-containing protein [Maritimibacter sp. DP1N21-5]MBV7407964.1 flagellar hook assembly protein FlgD [Maritimibacter sp. DP1N21-5]